MVSSRAIALVCGAAFAVAATPAVASIGESSAKERAGDGGAGVVLTTPGPQPRRSPDRAGR